MNATHGADTTRQRTATANNSAGRRLTDDLSRDDDPYRITVMIIEAGRVADRLERLAGLLSGERSSWLHVRVNRDQIMEVQVDKALQEARQQAGVLRQLLAEIHKQRSGIPMGPDDDDVLDGL